MKKCLRNVPFLDLVLVTFLSNEMWTSFKMPFIIVNLSEAYDADNADTVPFW
jgi:hypothetical protein